MSSSPSSSASARLSPSSSSVPVIAPSPGVALVGAAAVAGPPGTGQDLLHQSVEMKKVSLKFCQISLRMLPGLLLRPQSPLVRHLVPPQPVLVVGGEGVDDDGDGQGEDEDAHDGADAADRLARQRGGRLRAVADWKVQKQAGGEINLPLLWVWMERRQEVFSGSHKFIYCIYSSSFLSSSSSR